MAGSVTVVDLSVTGVPELTGLAVKLTAEMTGRPRQPPGTARGRSSSTSSRPSSRSAMTRRNGLVGALCALARTTLVVLALRADFYGQAIRYRRLRQALQERHVVLGPMTAGQVREAVVRPVIERRRKPLRIAIQLPRRVHYGLPSACADSRPD